MIDWLQEASVRAVPTFNAGDQWNILWGVVEGSAEVLPKESMIALCKNNASAIPA
jgi:hypothetical protein